MGPQTVWGSSSGLKKKTPLTERLTAEAPLGCHVWFWKTRYTGELAKIPVLPTVTVQPGGTSNWLHEEEGSPTAEMGIHAAWLVRSPSYLLLRGALKENHSDHERVDRLALKHATHILSVAHEPWEWLSIDGTFFCFPPSSCHFKS